MTLLLEAVREKESLWNTKSEAYKNPNVKKAHYEEVLQVIKEELPDVDLASLKGMPTTVVIVNIKQQCMIYIAKLK